METATVIFLPHNRKIKVNSGENLIRAAMEAGVHVNASCGGEGVCGKCRIIVEKGELSGGTSDRLSRDDMEKGVRLACKSTISGDVTIRIPVESSIDISVLNQQAAPRHTARITQMDLNDLKEQGLFDPPIVKEYIILPVPDSTDHIPDVSRLVDQLRKKHPGSKFEFTLPVIRKLPDILRSDEFRVTVTLEHPVRDGGKTRVINIQTGDRSDHNFAVALDIGTTTIYGQLINLKTGEILSEFGDFNGQISYGEDVISRIVFAEKDGGLETLSRVVLDTINRVIGKIIKKSGIDPEEVSTVTIAGNTTMTQLLLKINPKYIRRAPYVPAACFYPPVKAAEIGIESIGHASALIYSQISSYVGGDIVAGIMGSGMYRTDDLTLFMDIGTNAEIVIGCKDWMVCAACSAGPAFEGGGIEFGMRAARGAIEDFSIDPISMEPMIITIGSVLPKGICGSGLITMVAVLFETGVINNMGKFNRDLTTDRIRERNDVWEYVLAWKEQTQVDRDIVLTEIDIENLIRAKGAIYSGCQTLLAEVGLSIEDLDRVILAGGFGSYVNLEKAMTIGLLPEVEPEKVIFVGNGSLMGAKMSGLTNRIRQDVVAVTKMMTSFELSETHSYMDNYVASLFLPHTNISLFPKLGARLRENNIIR